ncbi:MAG: sugar phosphate nucleotidyltransferase [Erysipelotrichaceae bacterium]|nr:sugar phosphate nucleotidyltransferase [Erysipelotrichaceae bacterium]
MREPVLVILAAGMGSRYGGLKQIDVVGDNGECIIDFSIYDAILAGFKKVVLIIRKKHKEAFDQALANKISPFIKVEYAFQDMDDLPEGFTKPEEREKPWGTTHAILACRHVVNQPFVVINADDYYGRQAFKTIYDFLLNEVSDDTYGMVGYVISNTLTDHGTVSRGVCEVKDGYLDKIVERKKIKKDDNKPYYEDSDGNWHQIANDNLVSMNFWGFAPSIMDHLQPIFARFLKEEMNDNPLKCEHVIPTAIDELIHHHNVKVKMLRSNDTWYGITYKEDKENIMRSLARLKAEGKYPPSLWQK